jgi:hypothetical protein
MTNQLGFRIVPFAVACSSTDQGGGKRRVCNELALRCLLARTTKPPLLIREPAALPSSPQTMIACGLEMIHRQVNS